MIDLATFDPNSASNPNNNIFGLPINEEDARLVILPVPWEVTVSYNAGTARASDHILKASMQVDLFDRDFPKSWQHGFYLKEVDKKVLIKSDYLRKEAELYIDYISRGEEVSKNQFMCKSLKEINEGGNFLNKWVYEKSKEILSKGKLLGLLGGDHSIPLGYFKALSEQHDDFGILQIDAHCDLRKAYEGFVYSHASIMYNTMEELPQISKLVQIGIRDYSEEEELYIANSNHRIVTYFDRDIKERQFEGQTWRQIADEIVTHLPAKVIISFDVDGMDPKLCPNTGTPVPGGFETDQLFFLFKRIVQSGRQIIGFDLNETGLSEMEWDTNVSARILLKLCNLLAASNPISA
ncbi:MAG: arginase family protein [Chitinophagaceae bacterium]|nr:arginase family protein [Chitinophagaceae bacterium]